MLENHFLKKKKLIQVKDPKSKSPTEQLFLEESLKFGKIRDFEKTLTQINKLLELEPKNNIALYIKSVISDQQGDYSEYDNSYKKALEINHLEKKEDIIMTIELLDRAMDVFPHEFEGLSIRASLILKLGETCNKEEFLLHLALHLKSLEKTIVSFYKSTGYQLGYKFMWHNTGSLSKNSDKKEMNNCSNKSMIVFSTSTFGQLTVYHHISEIYDLLLEKGYNGICFLNNTGIAHSVGLYDKKAAESFNKALEIDPNYIYALNNLGVVSKSLENFDKVLKLDSQNFAGCFNKSLYLYHLKNNNDQDIEDARIYCEKALSLVPDDKQCWYLYAKIQASLGKKEKALVSYNKAVELDPNNVDLLDALSGLLIGMKKYKEALIVLDKGTDVGPWYEHLWEHKIYIYQQLGNLEGENECIIEMSRHHEYAPGLLEAGIVLIDRGEFEEAFVILDKIHGCRESDFIWPLALIHKARVRAAQGNKTETFNFLKDAMKEVNNSLSSKELQETIIELFENSLEFNKFQDMEEFTSILSFDWANEHKIKDFIDIHSLNLTQLDREHLDLITFLCRNSEKDTYQKFYFSELNNETYLRNKESTIAIFNNSNNFMKSIARNNRYKPRIWYHDIEYDIEEVNDDFSFNGHLYNKKLVFMALDILEDDHIFVEITIPHLEGRPLILSYSRSKRAAKIYDTLPNYNIIVASSSSILNIQN